MSAGLAFMLSNLFLLLASLPTATAAQNFPVPWSDKRFGPDGPWQAVKIKVGGNDTTKVLSSQKNVSEISVYPGGEYETVTISSSACRSFPNTQCGSGGFWEYDETQAGMQPVAWPADWTNDAAGINILNAKRVILGITINEKTVWNATLANARTGNITYPNAKTYGPTLGYLSLGANEKKQFFTTSADAVGKGYNASLYAGQLFEDKVIPSYTYGLHIGSAAFNYTGSLVFGGYNKGRVIGPVSAFENQNSIDLIDISIDTAVGGSPFSFTGKRDKLLNGGQISVTPEPRAPYLSLSPQTCENIASNLPVTLDRDLGYYLWNTNDSMYSKIVSSPAYLGFTFPPQPGSSDNVVIKVPFALLNLTLESPITDTPKQYFPCVPYKGKPQLGRAFFQAAFLGRNWNTKISWLAQAPGPGVARKGLGEQNTDISDGATMIDVFPGNNLFVDSWKDHWTVIKNGASANSGNDNNSGSSSDGLSTGGKAGIGVGAALGAIILIAGLIFFLRRRRSAKNSLKSHTSAPDASNQHDKPYSDQKIPAEYYAHQGHHNWNNHPPAAELPEAQAEPVELGDTGRNTQR